MSVAESLALLSELHTEDRRTPYPRDAVERACRAVGLPFAGVR